MADIRVRIGFVGLLAEQVARVAAQVRPVLVAGLRDLVADIFRRSQARVSGPVLRVRTGLLRQSGSMLVRETATGAEGTIGYRAVYAQFHEFGTRPYVIRARNREALRFMGRDGQPRFARAVHHPGLRPRPFLAPSMAEVEPTVRPRLTQLVLDTVHGAAR